MATINLTLTVPDDKAQEILDAYAAEYGLDPESPLTKLQFLKRGVVEHVRAAYANQKTQAAQQSARAAALAEVNSVPIT